MKVSFNPVRFNSIYNTKVAFGHRNGDGCELCGIPDSRADRINHDYDIKSSYLAELAETVGMPKMMFKREKLKLQDQRDFLLNSILGDDEDDYDILEKMSY